MWQSICWSGQGLLHEQVSFTFDKREASWILMHLWNWTDVYIWNNSLKIHLYNIFFYQMIIMWKPGTGQYFIIKANSLWRQR